MATEETDFQDVPESDALDQPRHPLMGMTLRAMIISVVLCIIASFWINQAEVISHFCQITEAVPPIPAVGFLLLLAVLNPFVRAISKRLSLERREIIIIYVLLTVATTVAGCGIGRFFFNTLPVLFYFDTPENNFQAFQQYMPEWMVPHDSEVIRQVYEASKTGAVPWAAWATPLAMWGLFFLAFWVIMLAVATMFRRQWSEKEKLAYPLLYLPLEVTHGVDTGQLVVNFFKNPVMWVGFAIAFLYNATNIINAFNPGFTAVGKQFDFGQLFTEHPLTALRPMAIRYRPAVIGFGYLVSTEILFSVWFFYFALKAEKLFATMGGVELAGYPYWQERGLGAYVALALLLAWVGRHHLAAVFRKAFVGDPDIDDSDEPMSYRVAVFGGIFAFLVVIGWLVAAGMAPWLAVVYIGLILMTSVVYARIRAEVGVPVIWMYPYYQSYKGIRYFLGSEALKYKGSWESATIFSTLVFMSRGYYSSMMGYQVEGFRLARGTGIKQKAMTWVLIIALVLGFSISMTGVLRAYYEYGAGGLTGMAGWGSGIAQTEYEALTNYETAPVSPDVPRIVATSAGFVITVALMLVRMVFLRFPLHPLAFAMICSYGELIWGPFFLVWIVKSIVFKLGGMRMYRQLIPLFIGLAVGHYFTAGILYGLFGTYGGEAVQRYGVWFG
ncbi:MAG: DUF6785 family protein [Armatimonadota bacterium]